MESGLITIFWEPHDRLGILTVFFAECPSSSLPSALKRRMNHLPLLLTVYPEENSLSYMWGSDAAIFRTNLLCLRASKTINSWGVFLTTSAAVINCVLLTG